VVMVHVCNNDSEVMLCGMEEVMVMRCMYAVTCPSALQKCDNDESGVRR